MIGYRDIQDYAENISEEKEKKIINKLKIKFDTMLGYRTDKMQFEESKKRKE
jgi:hypothetical protein